MHIPTHVLSGWCIGSAFRLSPRERLLCMIAAGVSDVDGLGIVAGLFNRELGQKLYWDLHHALGHNVFFGLLTAGACAALSTRRGLMFVLTLALFHLHMLMDFFGSGPGWMIHYFWPASPIGFKTDLAWELTSWQNRAAFGLLLAWTTAIARQQRRTPLELLAPSVEAKLMRIDR